MKIMDNDTLIIVTADWEKASMYLKKVCYEVAKELKLNLEERKEDWEFLVNFGQKDDIGGVDIPQAFIKLSNGRIVHLMTRVPLTSNGEPDLKNAKELIIRKIIELKDKCSKENY
jgi:hypothetical protein